MPLHTVHGSDDGDDDDDNDDGDDDGRSCCCCCCDQTFLIVKATNNKCQHNLKPILESVLHRMTSKSPLRVNDRFLLQENDGNTYGLHKVI